MKFWLSSLIIYAGHQSFWRVWKKRINLAGYLSCYNIFQSYTSAFGFMLLWSVWLVLNWLSSMKGSSCGNLWTWGAKESTWGRTEEGIIVDYCSFYSHLSPVFFSQYISDLHNGKISGNFFFKSLEPSKILIPVWRGGKTNKLCCGTFM